MGDFFACVTIEQGGYWVLGVGVFLMMVIIAFEFFCIRTLPGILKDRLSKIAIKIGEKINIELAGKVLSVLVIVLMFVITLAPLSVAWYGYGKFKDYYAVGIDAQGVDTVDSIRSYLSRDPRTHVTIVVDDRVKNFPVRGTFQGACVADMMDAIRRAYPQMLRCERSYMDRTLTITVP